MTCPRCGIKMRVQERRFHKQEKWICPNCRRVRMRPARYKRRRGILNE